MTVGDQGSEDLSKPLSEMSCGPTLAARNKDAVPRGPPDGAPGHLPKVVVFHTLATKKKSQGWGTRRAVEGEPGILRAGQVATFWRLVWGLVENRP